MEKLHQHRHKHKKTGPQILGAGTPKAAEQLPLQDDAGQCPHQTQNTVVQMAAICVARQRGESVKLQPPSSDDEYVTIET